MACRSLKAGWEHYMVTGGQISLHFKKAIIKAGITVLLAPLRGIALSSEPECLASVSPLLYRPNGSPWPTVAHGPRLPCCKMSSGMNAGGDSSIP